MSIWKDVSIIAQSFRKNKFVGESVGRNPILILNVGESVGNPPPVMALDMFPIAFGHHVEDLIYFNPTSQADATSLNCDGYTRFISEDRLC